MRRNIETKVERKTRHSSVMKNFVFYVIYESFMSIGFNFSIIVQIDSTNDNRFDELNRQHSSHQPRKTAWTVCAAVLLRENLVFLKDVYINKSNGVKIRMDNQGWIDKI